jgi:oligosaccharide repeat unit polymerase
MNNKIVLLKKSPALFVLLIISVLLGGIALIAILGEPVGESDWFYPIVFFATVWIVTFLIAAWRAFGHIYLFSTAYLTALILFHMGLFYQRAMESIKFPPSWEHGAFSRWLENAGWHILLALCGFGVGFCVVLISGKQYFKDIDQKLIDRAKKAGHWSAIGLLIASSIFFMMAIYSYGNLLNYARHEIFSSHADSRGFGAFMMVFPSSVLLYYFSAFNRKQRLIGLCLAVFTFLMFLVAGYRSAALFPTLVGVALWIKSGRKLPLPIVAGGVVLVLTLIAASGYLRTMGKYSELDVNDVSKALDSASIENSISEMGASVKALASVIQLVPETDDYRYGSSYVFSLLDALPNVGSQINKESSREYAVQNKLSDPESIRHLHPADWLTYRIAPWDFSHGFGVGFSAIAEPYLNFGTAGVFFMFCILGYALGKLDSLPLFQSPYWFIFSAAMLWPLIRTVRNDSTNFFKPVVFIFFILVAWWLFSRMVFRKKI